jgi:hypothetical protein
MKKTIKLNEKDSMLIERLFYTNKSYESLLSVISREYFEENSSDYREMIEHYRSLYQKANIEFTYAKNTLFENLLGFIPSCYEFDFYKQEVVCEW